MVVIMPSKTLSHLSPSRQGAGVAQLVEQRFRKPQVARSIRVAGSISHKAFFYKICLWVAGGPLSTSLNGRPEGIRRGCVPFVGMIQGGRPPS